VIEYHELLSDLANVCQIVGTIGGATWLLKRIARWVALKKKRLSSFPLIGLFLPTEKKMKLLRSFTDFCLSKKNLNTEFGV